MGADANVWWTNMLERRRTSWLLAVLVIAPVLFAGCVETPLDKPGLYVVASAPREAGGLTLFLQAKGLVGKPDGQATYVVRFGDELVYPPGGLGGVIPVKDGRGTVFLPYNLFVIGNGEYTVDVAFGDHEASVTTEVEKWVSYVYLHPYDRGNRIVIDVQLSRATGGAPTSRIATEGQLNLAIHYRGQDGNDDRPVGSVLTVQTNPDESFTRIEIPRSRFTEGTGYYSVEPVFHNHQARGNLWVGPDPTMAHRNPPWNWIYVVR